jgi:hypothetical protein
MDEYLDRTIPTNRDWSLMRSARTVEQDAADKRERKRVRRAQMRRLKRIARRQRR